MEEYDVLQIALIKSMNEEILKAENQIKGQPDHVFSSAFEASMQRLISHQNDGKVSEDPSMYKPSYVVGTSTERIKYRSVRAFKGSIRRTTVAILIAILIMAISATAIAVIKPGIYYKLREMIEHWDIIPHQERADEDDAFIPVKIKVPKGYTMIAEEYVPERYWAEYEDNDGHTITCYQYIPEESSIYFDPGENADKTSINGHEAFISRNEDSTQIITDNGDAVVMLSGTCTYEELYNIAVMITESNE